MKYIPIENSVWIRPRMAGWKFACCDCGLVHRAQFRIVVDCKRHVVEARFERDERATGQRRRRMKEATNERFHPRDELKAQK